MTHDRYRRAQSFRILLRSEDDVKVIARPPWWNLPHLLWGLSFTLLCLLGSVVWASVLRSRVASQTLQLRQTNEELQLLSTKDGLTGAANRRKFDEAFALEIARCSRSQSCLSLILVDIDHFKMLNDTYGHQRGDECLVQVVQALQARRLRETDVIARYGGEEFAILLPDTDRAGAIQVAEQIRQAVMELGIPHEGSCFGQVLTVSLGVATVWPTFEMPAASLIERADRALYRSKSMGRNRVSCEMDELESELACPGIRSSC